MKKILIVAGLDLSLINFRRELIESWLEVGCNVVAAAPGRRVEKVLEGINVSYYELPLERTGLNPFKDIALLLTLVKLLKKVQPDYLFLYTVKPVIYGSLAAYWRRSCRVFSMITGLGYAFSGVAEKSLLRKLIINLYRIALKRNEKVFFQNPDDSDTFEKFGIAKPEQIVRINGSGVNVDYFRPVPLPEGAVNYLLIARLLKEKGIVEYMEAARNVKRKYPQVRFAMIGWAFDDNPSAIGQKQVEEWRKEGMVEIFDETDDVRPFIAEAGVYVLPSYREGTPRTVLEAMAMGRPVITSDAPGCRETVVEGVNGFLVPVKNSVALAEAMERFILEPDLMHKMGAESRKIAEEKYDVHKVNEVINRAMGLLKTDRKLG